MQLLTSEIFMIIKLEIHHNLKCGCSSDVGFEPC